MRNFWHNNAKFIRRQFHVCSQGVYAISKLACGNDNFCPNPGFRRVIFLQIGRHRLLGKDGRLLVQNEVVRQFKFIASNAVKSLPYHIVAALCRCHPRPIDKGWVISYMLWVSTTEKRNRISLVVQSKSGNRSFHGRSSPFLSHAPCPASRTFARVRYDYKFPFSVDYSQASLPGGFLSALRTACSMAGCDRIYSAMAARSSLRRYCRLLSITSAMRSPAKSPSGVMPFSR